ncbi:MAG: 50S ribosomal protein L29 [Thainema sp.]
MALPKISEIRDLSAEDLNEQIQAARKQLFDLRFQKATRQLEGSHQFKHTRHRLAQLLTVQREQQLEQASTQTVDSKSAKVNSESTPAAKAADLKTSASEEE